MKPALPVLFALLLLVQSAATAEIFRIWKNTEGVSIEARLVESKADSVVLEMRNARRYEVPLAKLSAEDIAWLDSAASASGTEAASAGPAIEPLMTRPGKLLLEDSLSEIAEGWQPGKGQWSVIDGALNGVELAADDHAATFRRKMAFQDALIQYSFKLAGESPSTTFSVNDAVDHVCRVSINPAGFTAQKDDHDHEGPDKGVPFNTAAVELEPGEWHTILIEIKGDTIVAQAGDEISFGSHELIGAVEKASFGFTLTGENIQFKDFKMWEALPNEEWEKTRARLDRRAK